MTALDAFTLSPADWDDVESSYEAVDGLPAEEMLVQLLQNTTKEQQKWLALGLMVGRASR
jgi:hypothetical protein